jgi:hypothetical protein
MRGRVSCKGCFSRGRRLFDGWQGSAPLRAMPGGDPGWVGGGLGMWVAWGWVQRRVVDDEIGTRATMGRDYVFATAKFVERCGV